MESFTLRFPESLRLNDDERFYRFCRDNELLKIERRNTGDFTISPLAGAETSSRNADITTNFGLWNRRTKWGVIFGSMTGFTLPDTSVFAANVAGTTRERWEAVPPSERIRFAPICPDFVLELRSPSDRLKDCKAKMDDWIANGVRLGWLVDYDAQTVHIYRPGQPTEERSTAEPLSGEDVLPSFLLQL